MNPLNSVETTVNIGGENIDFFKLELTQEFNNHHKLEVTVDFNQLDSLWMNNLVSVINKIGEPIIVTMAHRKSGETNIFGGIITNVSALGEHGEQNYYVITGMSQSIKLDGYPGMDSFINKSLKDIVSEIATNSGSGAIIKNEPQYAGIIDYFCQYNESAFQVLNRLSWLYNEWFFDDGTTTYFGKPATIDEVELTYDQEITRFNLSANLVPAKFTQFSYLGHRPLEICQQAPDNLPEVRGFIQAALNRSNNVYTSNAFLPSEPIISDSGELENLVQAEKARAISDMLVFEGQSLSCKVKIGSHIQILLPSTMRVDKMVEKFLVTKVVHVVDQAGRYRNSFSGIPARMRSVPMQKPEIPKVGPQIATVLSSVDEEGKGRIKVQFQWQKIVEETANSNKSTNWIRVQTPDAGKSDKVSNNRGMVFIPEVGDQVMVSFEYNDPSRPFVQGSMFPENHGSGGGKTNNSKSLTTRSGSSISLDDDNGQGSITIKDPSGNIVIMDGAGNITINAPESITVNSKQILVNGKELIQFTSEKMIKSESLEKIELGANQDILIHAETKVRTESPALIEEEAPKITTTGTTQVEITGGTSVDIKGTATNIKGTPLNLN